MKILTFISEKSNIIKPTVVELIFLQLLLGTADFANVACNQKGEGGTCNEFVSGWDKTEYNDLKDTINIENNTVYRPKRNYVSRFTINELLKLKVRKSMSNDLDMDPEKSGLLNCVLF